MILGDSALLSLFTFYTEISQQYFEPSCIRFVFTNFDWYRLLFCSYSLSMKQYFAASFCAELQQRWDKVNIELLTESKFGFKS